MLLAFDMMTETKNVIQEGNIQSHYIPYNLSIEEEGKWPLFWIGAVILSFKFLFLFEILKLGV